MHEDSGTAKEGLLELYEARGDPDTFAQAKRLYELALAGAGASDPAVLLGYGYLLECHSRYSLREAVGYHERAIELDPDADKPHYQLILADAALGEPEHDAPLTAEWPRQELKRLRGRLSYA